MSAAHNNDVLSHLVVATLVVTWIAHETHPSRFLRACLLVQAVTLHGIAMHSPALVQLGHAGFGTAICVGAAILPVPQVWIVRALCVLALGTRRKFSGCLFDLVADSRLTRAWHFDVLLCLPLAISCLPR